MTHKFTHLGKSRTIFTRATGPGAPWYFRHALGGRPHMIHLGTHLRAEAERNAREIILAALQGADKFAALREATRQRRAVATLPTTLAALEAAYRAAAAGRIDGQTIHRNILALRLILARGSGADRDPKDITLDAITGDLVHDFKRVSLAAVADAPELERRRTQRTVNSYLRQARSLFTAELASTYRRSHDFELPPCIKSFMDEPGFGDVAKSRDEYNLPSDHLLNATFAALPKLLAENRNAWLAIWLAIGFGLRKEEIAGVRGRNFLLVQGRPSLELEEVWVNHTCKTITKNHTVKPVVPVANGAWEHLEPHIRNIPRDAYLLTGSTTERTDATFRAVSAWMRGLGWNTLKTIHEFRAYAGCQVAMRDGIYQASKWLRHSSVTVTEKNYSRYVVTKITNAPLSLPEVESTFTPQVLPATAG